MYDWKSNTCTREEWESTPKHEKFYCTIRKPDRVRYAEAKNRCVEKVHEAQKDCMKDRDCPLNHDFFQCCAAKAVGGDNGGIDSYCSRGKMKERGEYCYNVFKETQNFRRVFHEIPHSFEVKFVFYSFQVPLWQCLWLSLFTRFFEVQRCCSKSFEVIRVLEVKIKISFYGRNFPRNFSIIPRRRDDEHQRREWFWYR